MTTTFERTKNNDLLAVHKGDFTVKLVLPKLANKIICKNHYSKTVAKGVLYHLGIFKKEHLYGIAQFGYGIMPMHTCQWVSGTKKDEYLELNRLWISDILGKNTESFVIPMLLKFVREKNSKIKWIISFADGAMGKVGTIYQATNFIYTGFRKDGGIWTTKEGKRMHSVSLWHKHGTIKRNVLERIYGKPLFKVFGGQYRYFFFIDKKYAKKLVPKKLPYPKIEDTFQNLVVKTGYAQNSTKNKSRIEQYFTTIGVKI